MSDDGRMTYLVGTPRRFKEYCQAQGVSTRGWYVVHVETLRDLSPIRSERDSVLFLHGWMELPEWRAIYNKCLANGWAQPWKREGP